MQKDYSHLAREEIAWAAGLFDGEGYIGLIKHHTSDCFMPRLQITMAEPGLPALKEIQRMFGGTLKFRPSKNPNWQHYYCWRAFTHQAKGILLVMLPYLRVKGSQAVIATKQYPNEADYRQVRFLKGLKRNLKFGPTQLPSNDLISFRAWG